jgi:hypothetical protein
VRVVQFARLPGSYQIIQLMLEVRVQHSWDILASGNFPLEGFLVFSVLCSSCHIDHLLNSRILLEYVPDIYYPSSFQSSVYFRNDFRVRYVAMIIFFDLQLCAVLFIISFLSILYYILLIQFHIYLVCLVTCTSFASFSFNLL